jgi:hypothetical protein
MKRGRSFLDQGPLLNDLDRKLTVFNSKPQASKVFIRGSALPSVGSPSPILAQGKLEPEIRNLFRNSCFVNPRVPIVLSAAMSNGLNHRATKGVRFAIPTDGKAELRMKSRRTFSGPTVLVQPPLSNGQLPKFHFDGARFDTACLEPVHPLAVVDRRRPPRASPESLGQRCYRHTDRTSGSWYTGATRELLLNS